MTANKQLKQFVAWTLLRSQTLRLRGLLFERQRAILLLYHRVNDDGDPFFPALGRRLFSEQLDYVARRYRVEPLEQVMAWLDNGANGPPRLAITVDDGYPDTLEVVLPELERRGLPATLFLATGPPETGAPLWTDRTRWLLKHARAPMLDMPWLGLPKAPLEDSEGRLRALVPLLRRLKALPAAEIEHTLSVLETTLEPQGPALRLIGWDDVRRISRGPIRLGAHTHRHFMLSRLSDEEQEAEVEASARLIEQRAGFRVTCFAYPNGEPADYDARSMAVLRRHGFRYAFTASPGLARPGHDRLQLPRIHTNEPSIALFAARLAGLSPHEPEEISVE